MAGGLGRLPEEGVEALPAVRPRGQAAQAEQAQVRVR